MTDKSKLEALKTIKVMKGGGGGVEQFSRKRANAEKYIDRHIFHSNIL
jgi:hypothetical protein